MSVQVNMALRTQIVQYVTTGVRNAVRRTHLTPPKKSAFVDIFSGSFSSKKDKAVVPGLEVLEFLLDGNPLSSCHSSPLPLFFCLVIYKCGLGQSVYICRAKLPLSILAIVLLSRIIFITDSLTLLLSLPLSPSLSLFLP